jgi:hypothetical protein
MLMRAKSKKAKPKEESFDLPKEFFETDFGDRKVSHVNKSRMIAIPKLALENLCNSTDGLTMAVSLVQNAKERFLKLVPVDDEDIDVDSQDEDEDDDEEDE